MSLHRQWILLLLTVSYRQREQQESVLAKLTSLVYNAARERSNVTLLRLVYPAAIVVVESVLRTVYCRIVRIGPGQSSLTWLIVVMITSVRANRCERHRKGIHSYTSNISPSETQSKRSNRESISHPLDCQSPRQAESDLLYLNILNDAVKGTTESSPPRTTSSSTHYTRQELILTPRNCLWTKLPQLDDIDNEYLVKKGIFDLPSPHQL